MKKKINVGFTISENVKLNFEKLARDRNLSKSELAEHIILSYFDSKKEQILQEKIEDVIQKLDEKKDSIFLEKIDESIREIKQQNKLILSLIDKTDVEKIIKETIEEFVNQAKKL